MNGRRQGELLKRFPTPRNVGLRAEVEENEFGCTRLETLNDHGRIGAFGRPEEQMKMLGHQHPADDAEILLLAKLMKGSDEMHAEAVGIK